MNRFTSLLSSMLSPHTNRMNNNNNNDHHSNSSGDSPSANSSTSSHNNNDDINDEEDEDEMSADLLSQESPSQLLKSRHSVTNNDNNDGTNINESLAAAAGARPSLQSDVCVWNSTKKHSQKQHSNDENQKGAADNGAVRDDHNDNINNSYDDNVNSDDDDNVNSKSMKKKKSPPEEPWRKYDKSYARLSARNPANNNHHNNHNAADNNVADNAAAKNANNNNKESEEDKSSPPSSTKKKKRTHKLVKRLQHHYDNTRLSHYSSTNDDDDNNNNDEEEKNRPSLLSSPPSMLFRGGGGDGSPMGQEIAVKKNSNEEEEMECSPLTCPSQLCYIGGAVDDDDDEEEENEEEADGQKDDKDDENDKEKQDRAGKLKDDDDYQSDKKAEEQEEEEVVESTLVQNYTAALKASTTTTAATNLKKGNKFKTTTARTTTNTSQKQQQQQQQQHKRGIKRKPPKPLDLALIEETTTNVAPVNNSGSTRNKRKLLGPTAMALAEVDDSQTPPYELPTPRNNVEEEGDDEKKDEEDGKDAEVNDGDEEESMGGGNDDVNFSLAHNEEEDEMEELTGSEKQSEALLSSPSIPPVAAAAAASASENNNTSTKTTDEMVLELQDLIKNYMGKAIRCPVCIEVKTEGLYMLPCCHALCKTCKDKLFNPSGQSDKKKKGSSSPQRKYKECPACKKPADRRSVVPIPQLGEVGKAYKQVLVAFGLSGLVHDDGLAMTQLDPEENIDEEIIKNEADRQQCLQVARTVYGVVKRKKDQADLEFASISASGTLVQKQLGKQQVNRWKAIAKDQEKVVRGNDAAVNTVRAHQLVQRRLVQAETAQFVAESAGGALTTVNEMDESKVAAVEDTVVGSMAAAGDGDNESDDEVDFCTAPDGESVEYDTAKESQGQSQELSMTHTSAAASPEVIHDGNTVKKAERSEERMSSLPGSRVLDLEISPGSMKKKDMEGRESISTLATARASSSPIVLHDGNTVRKARPDKKKDGNNKKSSESSEDKTRRSSGNFLRCKGVAVKRNEEDVTKEDEEDNTEEYAAETQPLYKSSAPLKSSCQDDEDVESEYGNETQPVIGKSFASHTESKLASADEPAKIAGLKEDADELAQREQIVKGSVVMVQARTWPGINKHGGVGRVTKVHSSTESGGNAVKYDVTYVLGGKEKNVDESFVQLHTTVNEESPTRVASARKCRASPDRVESRRPKRTQQQKVTFNEEVRIYDEEELKHIPPEALEWAGIVPKKGKGGKKKAGEKKVAGKKRALADSNVNTKASASSSKKQKATSKSTSKPKSKTKAKNVKTEDKIEEEQPSATEDVNTIIGPLSNQEIVRLADERYTSLLSAESGSGSEVSVVLQAVTSNLSDEESDSLNSLCKLLKDKNGEHSLYLNLLLESLLLTANSLILTYISSPIPSQFP